MTLLQGSLIALGVCVALLISWLIYLRLFSQFGPLQAIFYFGASILVRWQWRAKLPKKLPIPELEGAVIVCNHRSSVDPFFVQMASHRKIYWMVAREFVENPLFGFFLRICEVIPVRRSGVDTGATKTALRYTAAKGLVGMFPEGRINMTEQLLLPCRPGAVVIALKSRVPLLPVYIQGSPYRKTAWSPFLMRARVEVRVGELIDVSEFYGREDDSELVQRLMLRVLREVCVLAGQPDFEIKLAGRNWKPTAEEIAADVAASEERRKRTP
ncbi:lysophospholipid acyltransferase family protein [Anatilimnocola floriformis]|uniref:lysophospholipid acyltransferase family protein n=1 Tax=Anatilimnocola floriformis TaxID=2948575 RepID=UPI0020C2CEA3|nr:lysophospholipid acyltransferase family protein [Anatilimnocola floriformis]